MTRIRSRSRIVRTWRTGVVVGFVAAWLAVLAACSPPTIERPLEGAQPGNAGDRAGQDRNDGPPPTLSPARPLEPDASPGPGASPDASSAASPSPASSPSPSPVAGYVIVATDGAGANMRTGPSTSAPVITTLREGTPVEVIGEPITSEGRAWRQIQSGGRQGWVVAVVVRAR
jgi:hypothetical protein